MTEEGYHQFDEDEVDEKQDSEMASEDSSTDSAGGLVNRNK